MRSSRISDGISTSPRSPEGSHPRGALFGFEGRLIALTKSLGKTRRLRTRRQRGDPRRGENRDLRSTDAAAYRLHAVEIPKGRFVLVEELAAMVHGCLGGLPSHRRGVRYSAAGATY